MSKMAAVRAVLEANPRAMPDDIVEALAKQKMAISESMASNYKSTIKKQRRRRKKRAVVEAAQVTAPVAAQAAAPPAPSGLDPALLELLKAGKELGWGQVRSIAKLMGK
jgi:hypothetical protein